LIATFSGDRDGNGQLVLGAGEHKACTITYASFGR
jgi:hypothetical protein